MNFEVGEKRARMVARARLRGSARECGAPVRSSAARDPGLARQVERRIGSMGERPGGGGRGELRPPPAPGVRATQLHWGLCPLLLLNLSALSCSAATPANFPGPSNKPGGVDGSREVKEA